MPLIPVPSRGTPIDVDLLAQIVAEQNSIRDLFNKVSGSNSSIRGVSVDTGQIQFYANEFKIVPGSQPGTILQNFTVTFPKIFRSGTIPIVTATVLNVKGSDQAIVTLLEVTNAHAKLNVRLTGASTYELSVHVIAMGLAV